MYQPANLLTQQGDARGVLNPFQTPPLCVLRLLSSVQINLRNLSLFTQKEGGFTQKSLKFYFLPFPCCTFELLQCLNTKFHGETLSQDSGWNHKSNRKKKNIVFKIPSRLRIVHSIQTCSQYYISYKIVLIFSEILRTCCPLQGSRFTLVIVAQEHICICPG